MSKSWASGSTAAWRSTRAAVLRANEYENAGRCQLDVGRHCPRHDRPCPDVCEGIASQVHHKRGKRYGDTRADLQATCKACNLHVGDPAAYAAQPRPRSNW